MNVQHITEMDNNEMKCFVQLLCGCNWNNESPRVKTAVIEFNYSQPHVLNKTLSANLHD